MKWLFKTIVDGVVNTCYEFDSKEKAKRYAQNYIEEMKKIGCFPLKGLEIKVYGLKPREFPRAAFQEQGGNKRLGTQSPAVHYQGAERGNKVFCG